MKASKNAHDWHCEDHDTYGWRGEACPLCPKARGEAEMIEQLKAENAEWKEKAARWCEAYYKTVNRKENISFALGIAVLIILGLVGLYINGWLPR